MFSIWARFNIVFLLFWSNALEHCVWIFCNFYKLHINSTSLFFNLAKELVKFFKFSKQRVNSSTVTNSFHWINCTLHFLSSLIIMVLLKKKKIPSENIIRGSALGKELCYGFNPFVKLILLLAFCGVNIQCLALSNYFGSFWVGYVEAQFQPLGIGYVLVKLKKSNQNLWLDNLFGNQKKRNKLRRNPYWNLNQRFILTR